MGGWDAYVPLCEKCWESTTAGRNLIGLNNAVWSWGLHGGLLQLGIRICSSEIAHAQGAPLAIWPHKYDGRYIDNVNLALHIFHGRLHLIDCFHNAGSTFSKLLSIF